MPVNPAPNMGRDKWQRVTEYTYRLKVPNGWVYRYDCIGSFSTAEGNLLNVSMVFVPAQDTHNTG
jgi:hypothetical protein